MQSLSFYCHSCLCWVMLFLFLPGCNSCGISTAKPATQSWNSPKLLQGTDSWETKPHRFLERAGSQRREYHNKTPHPTWKSSLLRDLVPGATQTIFRKKKSNWPWRIEKTLLVGPKRWSFRALEDSSDLRLWVHDSRLVEDGKIGFQNASLVG